MAGAMLTVTDPHYKGRLVALHEDLSTADLLELADVYRAIGYPQSCITIDQAPVIEEAA
jgi:hypothetical protein